MPRPAERLLGFLELLQASPSVNGRAAAERLGVDVRTIRRYAAALHDLGIPVEGQRGAAGGYRLRPGYRLPPLMLDDEEAAAVVFGLVATERMGLAAADGALAKIRRVLPPGLRRRAEALEEAVEFTQPASATAPAPATLLVLADAARRHRRVRIHYTSWSGAARTRQIDPFGLVVDAGRWYAPARDAASGELRTFRIDRMRDATLGDPAAPPPEGFDAVAYVARSLAQIPHPWRVEALIAAPLDEIADRIPPALGELAATDDGTLLRMRVESLDWAAQVLAGLGRPFTIHEPAELRASVRRLAAQLDASARRDPFPRPGYGHPMPHLEVPIPSTPDEPVVPETPTVPAAPTPDREAPTAPPGPGAPEPDDPQPARPEGPDVPAPDPKGPETEPGD